MSNEEARLRELLSRNRALSANNIDNLIATDEAYEYLNWKAHKNDPGYFNNSGANENNINEMYEKYGMYRKRGGGDVNGCGCLKNPFIRGYSQGGAKAPTYNTTRMGGGALIPELQELDKKLNTFLQTYPAKITVNFIPADEYDKMYEKMEEIYVMEQDIERRYDLSAVTDKVAIDMINKIRHKINVAGERAYDRKMIALGGGYKPTSKNLKYLKRYKQGKSIGFTMKSSLKAKGLIPRNSKTHRGKKIVSAKYK